MTNLNESVAHAVAPAQLDAEFQELLHSTSPFETQRRLYIS